MFLNCFFIEGIYSCCRVRPSVNFSYGLLNCWMRYKMLLLSLSMYIFTYFIFEFFKYIMALKIYLTRNLHFVFLLVNIKINYEIKLKEVGIYVYHK